MMNTEHAAESWAKSGREYWKCSCGGWEWAFSLGGLNEKELRFMVVSEFRRHAGR